MSVSEQERHQMYIAVESAIGTEGAATLMTLLPPSDWTDVARKSDVAALKSDVEALGERLSERMDALDEKWFTRMDALDERWSTRIEALDEKWSNRTESLEHRLSSKIDQARAEFFKSQEAQTRLVVFGMITMVVVVAALAFGAARLS